MPSRDASPKRTVQTTLDNHVKATLDFSVELSAKFCKSLLKFLVEFSDVLPIFYNKETISFRFLDKNNIAWSALILENLPSLKCNREGNIYIETKSLNSALSIVPKEATVLLSYAANSNKLKLKAQYRPGSDDTEQKYKVAITTIEQEGEGHEVPEMETFGKVNLELSTFSDLVRNMRQLAEAAEIVISPTTFCVRAQSEFNLKGEQSISTHNSNGGLQNCRIEATEIFSATYNLKYLCLLKHFQNYTENICVEFVEHQALRCTMQWSFGSFLLYISPFIEEQ